MVPDDVLAWSGTQMVLVDAGVINIVWVAFLNVMIEAGAECVSRKDTVR